MPELAEDPGLDTAERPRDVSVPKHRVAPGEALAAVTKALALLKRPGAGTASGAAVPVVMPSGLTRTALEKLKRWGTIEEFTAVADDREQPLNLKLMCRQLFDWKMSAGESTRATKLVARTVLDILSATGPDGDSAYAQGVEMLSLAAAAAPLLQPDRLIALLRAAPSVSTAFAPERYTVQLHVALARALSRYAEPKRLELLLDLWQVAHHGRWWDVTSGLVKVKPVRTIRGRGARAEEEEQRQAVAQQVLDLLAGHREGTPEANAMVAEALLAGRLPFNGNSQQLVRALPEDAGLRAALREQAELMRAGKFVEPDIALHASHVRWLLPAERPETPVTWLVKVLDQGLRPDPTTGRPYITEMPAKPRAFAELYPPADIGWFPYPPKIMHLDQTALPGTTAGAVLVEVVHSPAELAANRDYMRNCTWSYKDCAERGEWVLFRLWRGTTCYNAAMWHPQSDGHPAYRRGAAGAARSGVRWELDQIEGRTPERARPPEDIRAGFLQMIRSLGDAEPLPDLAERATRQVRYAVA